MPGNCRESCHRRRLGGSEALEADRKQALPDEWLIANEWYNKRPILLLREDTVAPLPAVSSLAIAQKCLKPRALYAV